MIILAMDLTQLKVLKYCRTEIILLQLEDIFTQIATLTPVIGIQTLNLQAILRKFFSYELNCNA